MHLHFPPVRLSVPHIQQHADGECLVACAAMIFGYLGLPFDYRKGIRLLQIRPHIGTPFFQIRELNKLGITVTYQRGTLADLYMHLVQGLPCIAGVQTSELPYWQEHVQHAVVVVGLDSDFIYLNDPAFMNGPIQVSLGDFDLAWLEQDEVFAVLIP